MKMLRMKVLAALLAVAALGAATASSAARTFMRSIFMWKLRGARMIALEIIALLATPAKAT